MHNPDIHSSTTVFQEPSSAEVSPSTIVHSTESLLDSLPAGAESGAITAALREADLVSDEVEELQKGTEPEELSAEVLPGTPDRAAYNAQIADEYVAFRGILTNYVKRKTGASFHNVEDAVQDAFLAALRLEQDSPPGRSFYFVVAFRAVMAQWRKGNRMSLLGEDTPRLSEEVTYNVETMEWVESALRRLPAPQRELAGRLILGQRGKEVAKELGIPERTARHRITMLRRKMTQMARDEEWH
jgi:RNA polymerase sigma factor (sigma-70 family)